MDSDKLLELRFFLDRCVLALFAGQLDAAAVDEVYALAERLIGDMEALVIRK